MINDAITSSKDVTPIEGDVMQFRTATELLQAASEAVEARDDDELLRRLHMVSLFLFWCGDSQPFLLVSGR